MYRLQAQRGEGGMVRVTGSECEFMHGEGAWQGNSELLVGLDIRALEADATRSAPRKSF